MFFFIRISMEFIIIIVCRIKIIIITICFLPRFEDLCSRFDYLCNISLSYICKFSFYFSYFLLSNLIFALQHHAWPFNWIPNQLYPMCNKSNRSLFHQQLLKSLQLTGLNYNPGIPANGLSHDFVFSRRNLFAIVKRRAPRGNSLKSDGFRDQVLPAMIHTDHNNARPTCCSSPPTLLLSHVPCSPTLRRGRSKGAR